MVELLRVLNRTNFDKKDFTYGWTAAIELELDSQIDILDQFSDFDKPELMDTLISGLQETPEKRCEFYEKLKVVDFQIVNQVDIQMDEEK